MSNFVHYDICAILILTTLLIMFSFSRRHIWFVQNMMFLYLLLAGMVACGTNVLAMWRDGQANAVGWLWFLNMAYFITCALLPLLAVLYFLLLTHRFSGLNALKRAAIYLPSAVMSLLALSSPLTGWIFTIDAQAHYQRGTLHWVVYATVFVYLCLWSYLVVTYPKNTRQINKNAYLAFGAAMLLANLAQAFWPPVMLEGLVMTLCLAVIYLTTQSANGYMDTQTKAYTRLAMAEAVDMYYEQKRTFWLLTYSLESMEKVNTVFGGTCSDQLLYNVVEYLNSLYPGKMVARLSGKRFGVLLAGNRTSIAAIRQELEQFPEVWSIGNSQISIVATKAALYSENFTNSAELLTLVNSATRTAKKHPMHVAMVDTNISAEYVRPMLVEAALERAIANKSFEVYYQPIFTVADGRLCAAEALARLYDRELGCISPAEFIPVAERVGLVRQIGEIVREKVFTMVSQHQPQQYGLHHISVNLSVIECVQENIHLELLQQLKEYDIDPSMIHLEITESASTLSDETLLHNVDALAAVGFCLHLDDYGTGYSNLMKLLEMPLDTIKLDRSLLGTITTESRRRFLGAHIASLHAMNVHVLCEGIETLKELEMIDEWSADYGQGYLYSKPLSEDDFLVHLQQVSNISRK